MKKNERWRKKYLQLTNVVIMQTLLKTLSQLSKGLRQNLAREYLGKEIAIRFLQLALIE